MANSSPELPPAREYARYLRIRHASIDPCKINRALGLEPLHAWAAGTARAASEGGAPEGAYTDTYWFGRIAVADPFAGMFLPWQPGEAADRGRAPERSPSGLLPASQVRWLLPRQAFFGRMV